MGGNNQICGNYSVDCLVAVPVGGDMKYLNAARYIVGRENEERIRKVAEVIKPVKEFAEPVCFEDLLCVRTPILPNNQYRFNYAYEELMDIAARCTPYNEVDIHRVFRYAMVFSGISVGVDCEEQILRDRWYSAESRYPRLTAQIHNKRLSLRALPYLGDSDMRKEDHRFSSFSYRVKNGKRYIENGKYAAPITG